MTVTVMSRAASPAGGAASARWRPCRSARSPRSSRCTGRIRRRCTCWLGADGPRGRRRWTRRFTRRAVVRMLGMRRTVFVVPAGLAPVVQAACTDDVAKRLRRRLEKDLAGGVGDGDPGGWLRSVGRGVLRVLMRAGRRRVRGAAVRGRAAAADAALELLDKSYGGTFNVTSVGAHAARRRGAPGARAPARRLVIGASPVVRGLDAGQACSPMTSVGWRAARRGSSWRGGGCARRARLGAPTCSGGVSLDRRARRRRWPLPRPRWSWDGQPGASRWRTTFVSGQIPPSRRCCPRFYPRLMGWQARDWFLGEHRAALFDRTGNIGPTVRREGRVVGGWAQRASGDRPAAARGHRGRRRRRRLRPGRPVGGVAGGEPGHPALPHSAGAQAQRVGLRGNWIDEHWRTFWLWL